MTYLRRLYYRLYWLFHKRPVYVPPVKRWVMLEGGPMNGELRELSTSRLIFFQGVPGTGLDYGIEKREYREDPERNGIFVYQ